MASILLVEDEEDLAFANRALLQRWGHAVEVVDGVAAARAMLRRRVFDLVLVDLSLRDGSGLELLEEIRNAEPSCGVVVVTGMDKSDTTARALRMGALDYLVKPITADLLQHTVRLALQQVRRATAAVGEDALTPDLARVLGGELSAVARARVPVLVTGETGTGKERVARLVHQLSPRADGPFVVCNVACLSPSLVEAELFGHEPGAFTGAQKQRRGLFEMANGGTLFLDEVGELSLDFQAKLLRVVEGMPFRRVGGEREIQPDVRLVSATHRDLRGLVAEKKFREDLYQRLKMFQLHLPPLRERPTDIAVLAEAFLLRAAQSQGESLSFSAHAKELLMAYPWPGNVRELLGVVERAALMAQPRRVVEVWDFPADMRPRETAVSVGETEPPTDVALGVEGSESLEDVIQAHVQRIYEREGRNLSRAAKVLGISRPTLRARLSRSSPAGPRPPN